MIDTETIECPACKTVQEVDVFNTINAMESPELVSKLMKREITFSSVQDAVMRLISNCRCYSTTIV